MNKLDRPIVIYRGIGGSAFHFDCDTTLHKMQGGVTDLSAFPVPVAVTFGEYALQEEGRGYRIVDTRTRGDEPRQEYSAKQVFDGDADGFITVLRFDKRGANQ